MNGKRSAEDKIFDPRPTVKESFTFDKAGNVTL
jgi:hypothetical protein